MPIVLVVDDSSVDRRLIGGLLGKKDEPEWVIEYANDGMEAVERMKDLVPDVVVTDLLMPQMDGLELVASVRRQHPHVPVVLITGQGSEFLAIDALEQGAASYVPKGKLAERLLSTVEQVIAVARADQSFKRLNDCFTKTRYTLRLENDTTLISSLVALFLRTLADRKFCDETERVHIGIALEEALLNALCHGNLELDSKGMDNVRAALNDQSIPLFLQKRLSEPPYCDRRILVDGQFSPEECRFVVRDQGQGFSHTETPKRGDPSTLEPGGGRGLILMHNFMDEVVFNPKGNEVSLVKKSSKPAKSSPS